MGPCLRASEWPLSPWASGGMRLTLHPSLCSTLVDEARQEAPCKHELNHGGSSTLGL